VGHGATYSLTGGYPFAEGPIAWLQYKLKDDPAAASMFKGPRCGFCRSNDWQLRRHLIE
jgi:hypothetical protein